MGLIFQLVPVLILSIPFFYFDYYLKRKIKPGKNFARFLFYAALMLPAALIYVTISMIIIVKLLGFKQ
jgi:hypothetical protein